MRKLTKKEMERFNKHLNVFLEELQESELDYLQIKQKLETLVTINSSLNRLNEMACNMELSNRQEKRQENLEDQAIAIIESLGFKGDTHRDPRGDAIMVYLPSGKYNSFDGESYRIGIY